MERNNYCRHWAANALEDTPEPAPAAKSPWFFNGPAAETRAKKVNVYAGNNSGLWVYCYPNTGISCYEPAWYSMRVLPVDKTHTRLEYEIYSRKGLEESKMEEFISFLREVEKEDFDLCEACQKNLNVGVYIAGALNPEKENGTLFYQSLVKKMVLAHLAIEKEKGEKINPAYAGLRAAKRGAEDGDMVAEVLEMEKVCRGLDTGCGSEEEQW
jgi:hypothetical protein